MFGQRLTNKIWIPGFALIFLLFSGCNAGPNTSASSISTPDIAGLVPAISPVVSGQGVPEAGAYNPGKPGPHHIVLLTSSGKAYNGCTDYDFTQEGTCIANDDWNNLLSSDWLPSSISETELVVLIGPEQEINLGTQAYDIGPAITAYRHDVNLEIREARTGRTLAILPFTGSDSRPFPPKAYVPQIRIDGTYFHYPDLENWLCPRITLQRCWNPMRTLKPAAQGNLGTFSPDGQILALGTYEGRVQLWQVSDGSLLRTLNGNDSEVKCVAFSPDGQSLAVGTNDGSVQVWQVSDGTLLRILKVDGSSVAFSPDLQVLSAGSFDGSVRLLRLSNGSLLRTLKTDAGAISGLAFSPDGKTLAVDPQDGPVQLRRVSNGSLLRTLKGHTSVIENNSFSPDGQTLAIGLQLWRISDGALLRTLSVFGSGLAFSPDGQSLVLIVPNDGSVRLWQLR